MKVRYSYLKDQFRNPDGIFDNLRDLVKTGDYTLGSAVEEFEERFAELIGVPYAVGVNSGTDALFLSLKALGIGPGDEVITVPNTFIATVGAIVATGAKPVFVDVMDDFTIDPALIEAAFTRKTRAILPVHYAGHPADMTEIMGSAEQFGLQVVEDACQAISASIEDRCVGTFGIAGGFSLHPLKNLNVWGDGGIIVTGSKELKNKLNLLRNHGLKNRDEVEICGFNSRLDTLQAVVGNYLINDMESVTETRIKWALRIDRGIAGLGEYLKVPRRKPDRRYVYHLYMLMAQDRDRLLAFLNNKGIEAKIHYPIPLHLQKAFQFLGYQKGDFPVTESQTASIITLPVHQHLNEGQVDFMIESLHEFYGT